MFGPTVVYLEAVRAEIMRRVVKFDGASISEYSEYVGIFPVWAFRYGLLAIYGVDFARKSLVVFPTLGSCLNFKSWGK